MSPARLPFGVAAAVAVTALVLACAQPNDGLGVGADGGATTSSDAGGDGPKVTGTQCGQLPDGQLCRTTTWCPSVKVDPSRFPNCGFRIRGSAVDLQCVCNGEWLCPMGTPSTCAQAAQLVSSQNELIVCAQISEDRCASLRTTAGSTSSSGGGTPDCDKMCLSTCDPGDSGCRKLCGC